MRRAALLLVVLLATLATTCGEDDEPAPPQTCSEMKATYIPPGFDLAERRFDGRGVLVIFRDASGERELSFLSGVPFDGHGAVPSGQIVEVRGHETEIQVSEPDTQSVVWTEAPVEETCHLYAVIGVGLPPGEFEKVLAGIE